MKVYNVQYHTENGWELGEDFTNTADIYMETMQMWNCEEFSMELQDWCDEASVGDVFEDEDIRVTVSDR